MLHKYSSFFPVSSPTKGHLGCFLHAYFWSCLSNQIMGLRAGMCHPYSVPTPRHDIQRPCWIGVSNVLVN